MTPLEKRMKHAYVNGRKLEVERGDTEKVIRATAIRHVLTDPKCNEGPNSRLHLVGAKISGPVDLEGALISAPLKFHGCTFDSNLILHEAELGTLKMPGCLLPGLEAANMKTAGDVELCDDFESTRYIDLTGATIGGLLRMSHSRFRGEDGVALYLSRARTSGLHARQAFFTGEVRMIGAKIEGTLSLKYARLSNLGQTTLNAQRCVVEQSVLMQHAVFNGLTTFLNASIGGGVDGDSATFYNTKGAAVSFRRATVGRNIGLMKAKVIGRANLTAASCAGFTFTKADLSECGELAMRLVRAREAHLRFLTAPPRLDLTSAQIEVIEDSKATWPSRIKLERCQYEHVEAEESQLVARDRLEWISRGTNDESGFRPGVYEVLASYYRSTGNESAARSVAFAKQKKRTRTLAFPARVFGYFLYITVGFGYRNYLAAVWLLGLTALGTICYSAWRPEPVPNSRVPFSPLLYTLDQLLPIVDIGQDRGFVALAPVQWLGAALALSGWALTTALIAGTTRVLNRT